MICQACNKNESIGVYCVPGCPVSMAYCRECLENNNHPIDILIANTACCNGLDNAADWWIGMVMDSLKCQGKSLEWFNAEVKKSIQLIDDYGEQENNHEGFCVD